MTDFFVLFFNFFHQVIGLLASTVITIAGLQVSFLSIVIAMILISFVLGMFWKGAKA